MDQGGLDAEYLRKLRELYEYFAEFDGVDATLHRVMDDVWGFVRTESDGETRTLHVGPRGFSHSYCGRRAATRAGEEAGPVLPGEYRVCSECLHVANEIETIAFPKGIKGVEK